MSAILDFFLCPNPEELVKKWKQTTKQQIRNLDKQLRQIETQQNKAKAEIKKCAKVKSIGEI